MTKIMIISSVITTDYSSSTIASKTTVYWTSSTTKLGNLENIFKGVGGHLRVVIERLPRAKHV